MKKTLVVMIVGVLLLSMFSVLRLALPDSSAPYSDPGWTKAYGGIDDDLAFTAVQASDGGYALAGYTLSYNIGLADFYLVKTDGSGSMQWNRTYGGMYDEIINSVIQTSDGGYALAGWTDSFGAGGYDFYLIKTDSLGNDHDPVHDVAVTNVHPLKTVVGKSSICKLNITVVNWGDFIEAFNVTAWAMMTPLTTSIQNVSIVNLSPHEIRTVTILWNATGWAYGNYTVGAAAATVPDELDTANNVYTDGWVTITIQGDVNGDKTVNVLDLILIATHLGHHVSEYTPYSLGWYTFNNCDLNSDGNIDVLGLIDCATHLGQHWP